MASKKGRPSSDADDQRRIEVDKRRADILRYIAEYLETKHFSPSLRELAALTGVSSTSVVSGDLAALREDGLVDWIDGAQRTLHLTGKGYETTGVSIER